MKENNEIQFITLYKMYAKIILFQSFKTKKINIKSSKFQYTNNSKIYPKYKLLHIEASSNSKSYLHLNQQHPLTRPRRTAFLSAESSLTLNGAESTPRIDAIP